MPDTAFQVLFFDLFPGPSLTCTISTDNISPTGCVAYKKPWHLSSFARHPLLLSQRLCGRYPTMVALTYFLPLLGFACLGRSAPMQESVPTTHVGPVKALCSLLPSTMMNKLCLLERRGRPSRQTVLGVAEGNEDPSGAQRFIVKYANSLRWEPSTLVSSWALPYALLANFNPTFIDVPRTIVLGFLT
jgi:hypothetical protein